MTLVMPPSAPAQECTTPRRYLSERRGATMDPRQKIFVQISDDLHAFFKRAGKVWIYDELRFLDLEPAMMTGEFFSNKVQSLIDFCASNPKYHIISSAEGKVYNKFVPKARLYYLADRDANPNLCLDFGSRLGIQDLLQVGHTMFAPKFSKIKGGDDP
jgi:hypothetical protein